jgi:hypothetical protein
MVTAILLTEAWRALIAATMSEVIVVTDAFSEVMDDTAASKS